MADELRGLRVAILVDNGFEEVELLRPRRALDEAGAQTLVVSPQQPGVRAWNFREWGTEVPVDVPLDRALPDDYDALLLPGGVMNPDRLRMQPRAVEFVKSFFDADKPVAVICHGPWTTLARRCGRLNKDQGSASPRTMACSSGAEPPAVST